MTVVENDVFRLVERQLYSYKNDVLSLAEQRELVLHSSPKSEHEGNSKANKSDPTALRGIKLAAIDDTNTARWVSIISYAMTRMPEEQRKLVRLKYFEERKDNVWDELHISRTLFYHWRERIVWFIILLATQRGLLRPIDEEHN